MATRPQQLQLKFLKQSMELLGTRLLYLGEMATDLSTHTHTQKMKIPWPSYKDLFLSLSLLTILFPLFPGQLPIFPFFYFIFAGSKLC
jgi:hypothetical protein